MDILPNKKPPVIQITTTSPDHHDGEDPFSIISSPETPASTASIDIDDHHPSTTVTSTDVDSLRSRASSLYSEGTTALRQRDHDLEEELRDEITSSAHNTSTASAGPTKANPYHLWECGFGFQGQLDAPAAIPSTKKEFLEAVKGEIQTVGFIQNGLISYTRAINSGEHHAFSNDFLKEQNTATNVTIGQLFQISSNLQTVVAEVEALDDDTAEVKADLREAFAHAQPWVQRTRAILVSSHVFYKINYVLASDKKETTV